MFQIKQLIIIAGPSAVGKSTLLRKIQNRHASCLCNQLDIHQPSSYLYLDAMILPQVNQSFKDRLILHYDFIHQYSSSEGFAYLSDLIAASQNTVVVTLYTSNTVLYKRITLRLTKVFFAFLRKPSSNNIKKILRLWGKRQLCKNTSKLLLKYKAWSEYIEVCGVTQHLTLNTTDSEVTSANAYQQDKINILMEAKSSKY